MVQHHWYNTGMDQINMVQHHWYNTGMDQIIHYQQEPMHHHQWPWRSNKSPILTSDLDLWNPQGSVPGPILFILYTTPLGDICMKIQVEAQFYADDQQIYLSFWHIRNKSKVCSSSWCCWKLPTHLSGAKLNMYQPNVRLSWWANWVTFLLQTKPWIHLGKERDTSGQGEKPGNLSPMPDQNAIMTCMSSLTLKKVRNLSMG